MTFLPIVERELRVAARQRGTFWIRLGVAVLAITIGISIQILNAASPLSVLGNDIFYGLSVMAFIYCTFAGRRFTADCLSEEKREGTLGLLFLTDLKGHDVVLGKLVATSLSGFYGLLAVFPVLAIPLLMGGVTNGQFWRMVLVLLETFFFSLAIGIFSSALSRDSRGALGLNFLLLLSFFLLLPVAAAFIRGFANASMPMLLLSSPGYGFYLASDVSYRAQPELFWASFILVQFLTWLLVFLTCRIVPNSWQDQPPPPRPTIKTRWNNFLRFGSYGNPKKQKPFRKRLLDINAFYWHAARARLKPAYVWVVLGFMGCWWIFGWLENDTTWLDASTFVTLAVMLNGTLKSWIGVEAGQRLAEDQKIGALELLLSTPLTVPEIVRGQILALRRQFLIPFVTITLLELYFMIQIARRDAAGTMEIYCVWLAGIFMLAVDIWALSWVSMRRALTAQNHNQATVTSMTLVLVLPWIGFGVVSAATMLLQGDGWERSWVFNLMWWIGFGLAADIIFGLQARRSLMSGMREFALQRYSPERRKGKGSAVV